MTFDTGGGEFDFLRYLDLTGSASNDEVSISDNNDKASMSTWLDGLQGYGSQMQPSQQYPPAPSTGLSQDIDTISSRSMRTSFSGGFGDASSPSFSSSNGFAGSGFGIAPSQPQQRLASSYPLTSTQNGHGMPSFALNGQQYATDTLTSAGHPGAGLDMSTSPNASSAGSPFDTSIFARQQQRTYQPQPQIVQPGDSAIYNNLPSYDLGNAKGLGLPSMSNADPYQNVSCGKCLSDTIMLISPCHRSNSSCSFS